MNETLVLNVVFGLIDRITTLGTLFQKARTEGRELTINEIEPFAIEAKISIANLQAAIDTHKNTLPIVGKLPATIPEAVPAPTEGVDFGPNDLTNRTRGFM